LLKEILLNLSIINSTILMVVVPISNPRALFELKEKIFLKESRKDIPKMKTQKSKIKSKISKIQTKNQK